MRILLAMCLALLAPFAAHATDATICSIIQSQRASTTRLSH